MRSSAVLTTRSGVRFLLSRPRAEDVCVEDIAHALSMLCRFCGHCPVHYSVAEHSVRVARLVGYPGDDLFLAALLHDAAEAYVADLPRGVKTTAGLAGYRRMENRIQRLIFRKFGLPPDIPEEVHRADAVLAATEFRDLFGPKALSTWSFRARAVLLQEVIVPWTMEAARAAFLEALRDSGVRSGSGVVSAKVHGAIASGQYVRKSATARAVGNAGVRS